MFQNFDWGAVATIVAAVIGLGCGALGAYRLKENWSPARRYRELRLLRSRESKAKEMNSASCDRVKDAFTSSIIYDDCELEQYRFSRELKNLRTNHKLGEESASLPDATMLEFAWTWLIIVLFLEGFSGLLNLFRRMPLVWFVFAVLILFCLSMVVWAFVTRLIKSSTWNGVTEKGFDDFLKPVFQEPRVIYDTQVEFQKAIQSFHKVYDNSTLLRLGKACSQTLRAESFALICAALLDTAISQWFHWNHLLWLRVFALVILTVIGIAFLCCYSSYTSILQDLIQDEKKEYSWYNPLLDAHYVQHRKILDKQYKLGHWLQEVDGKLKKCKERK